MLHAFINNTVLYVEAGHRTIAAIAYILYILQGKYILHTKKNYKPSFPMIAVDFLAPRMSPSPKIQEDTCKIHKKNDVALIPSKFIAPSSCRVAPQSTVAERLRSLAPVPCGT